MCMVCVQSLSFPVPNPATNKPNAMPQTTLMSGHKERVGEDREGKAQVEVWYGAGGGESWTESPTEKEIGGRR